MSKTSSILLFTLCFIAATSASHHHRRHLLHQPLFPQITILPPTQPPSLPPRPLPHPQTQTQPKYPFSTTLSTPRKPFFPSFPSPPPPPPPPPSSFLATFPANISSLLFPHHPPSTSFHRNLILTISVSLSFLFAGVLAVVASFFICSRRTHHHTPPKPDNLRLFPPDTVLSDGSPKPPKLPHRPGVPNTSAEFLYLGTLVNPHSGVIDHEKIASLSNASVKSGNSSSTGPYQKLGSPELNPLPTLSRYNIYTPTYRSGEVLVKKEEADTDTDEGEEFFSPRGSSGRKETLEDNNSSVVHIESSSRRHNYGSTSFISRTASYPYSNSCSPSISVSTSPSLVLKMSPLSSKSKSPDTKISFRAPVQVQRKFSPSGSLSASSSSSSRSGRGSGNAQNSLDQNRQAPGRIESVTTQQFVPTRLPPPPPPPPPPPRFWELPVGGRMVEEEVNLRISGPPVLVTPSMPAFVNDQLHSNRNVEMNEETPRPKLKPLHWDKVRASSDRAMVWDQIKSSSFQ